MKIAVVYGTRPEAVKLAPLVKLLPGCTVIFTGQHQTLAQGILQPTISLNLAATPDPVTYSNDVCTALCRALVGFDLVIVQGDTASAAAGAAASIWRMIPLAHVEAGLRTGDLDDPWPEEGFRRDIDRIAQYLFAPTEEAAHNLRNEPCPGVIHIVGNTGIDALYAHTRPIQHPYPVQPRVLVTLHRRESFGEPLQHIIQGLLHSARDFPGIDFLWPVHPNPEVQKQLPRDRPRNLYLFPPMEPRTFAQLLSSSRAVLTDSGGVQEEAAALGIPAVIARNVTDRPESIANYHALLAGTTSQGVQEGLRKALTYQLSHDPSFCFGDGHAAERIAQLLLNPSLTP